MTTSSVVDRLLAGDASLFRGDTARHSLGWLGHPDRYAPVLDDWAAQLPRRHERTIWIGIGGSSSGARAYADRYPDAAFEVIDTTHPDTVYATRFTEANIVVASKSGTTLEVQALLAWALGQGVDPRDVLVITDDGTTLAQLATTLPSVRIAGDPNTGGRFSSLSAFGLVAALYLAGDVAVVRKELRDARVDEDLAGEALALVETIAAGSTCVLPGDPLREGAALWLEQLVAESTGKVGKGIIPVPGPARSLSMRDMMRWHLATALLARTLDVDPFDQPNVDSTKRAVYELLRRGVGDDWGVTDVATWPSCLTGAVALHVEAFAPLDATDEVARLRDALATMVPVVTANLGPRYLHSTGQLHKGGPQGQVVVQIRQRPTAVAERISGRAYSFHDVHVAQFLGDERALRAAGRTVLPVVVDRVRDAYSVLDVAPLR